MLIFSIVFLQLISLVTCQQYYKALFLISPFGIEFEQNITGGLLLIHPNVLTINRCAMSCAIETVCQTFEYDSTSGDCRLFSIWHYQGSLILSSSATKRVGYVKQTASLYSLFNKSCNLSYDKNRYLSCSNYSRWSCYGAQFYDGAFCKTQNISNNTIAQYQQQCLENLTMQWNGTACVPSKRIKIIYPEKYLIDESLD